MIIKNLTYGCKCDNCGVLWKDENGGSIGFTTELAIRTIIHDIHSGWLHYHGQDYCPDCWENNHLDGGLILKHVGNDPLYTKNE